MPKILVIHSPQGKVLRVFGADGGQTPKPALLANSGEVATFIDNPDGIFFDIRMRKMNGGKLENLPPRPTVDHEYDYTANAWADPRGMADLVTAKHKAIEAARDARLNEPAILYDGMLLDADAGSKQNLQDKVTAMASRIAKNKATPPQMLVWKDRENKIHAFPDVQTYKDWLDGFVIALEERGMAAWGWSWQMKDALHALKTVEEVRAFTVPPISP